MKTYKWGKDFMFLKSLLMIPITLLVLHFTGCASGTSRMQDEVMMEGTSFSFSQEAHPFDLFKEYRIRPGDALDILFQARVGEQESEYRLAVGDTISVKFVNSSELNETQTILPDGYISLPYLGRVNVAGKTLDDLTRELREQYTKALQKNPEIYVVVQDFRAPLKALREDVRTSARGVSRLVKVRNDGFITCPILGDVLIANVTIANAARILNEKYANLIPGLHVDVFLEDLSGSSIYVVGMVLRAGRYDIAKPITVVEALALAGGHVQGAQLSSVVVLRKHESKIVATRVNVSKALSLDKGGELFYLEPDDTVYVPKTFISGTAELARDLMDIAFFRGVGLSFTYDLDSDESDTRVITP